MGDNKQEWLDIATKFFKQKDYKKALEALDKALQINPEDKTAWIKKGKNLNRLERYEEALKAYDKALQIDPEDALAWRSKGINLRKLERYEEALKAYDKALQINPDNANVWANKGFVLHRLEKYGDELEAYEKVLQINPKDEGVWLNKSITLSILKRKEEALEACEKTIRINPNNRSAWELKSLALCSLGKYKKALKACKNAIQIKFLELNPENSNGWAIKGIILNSLGKYEKALKACEKSLQINRGNAFGWTIKGDTLDKLYRYKESIEALTQAITINPEKSLSYCNLAELYFKLGNVEDAYKNVLIALEKKSNFVPALILNGMVNIEKQNYDAASEFFRKAIAAKPGEPKLLLWYSYANYLKTEFTLDTKDREYNEEMSSTIRTLEKACALCGTLPSQSEMKIYTYYFLGNFYFKNKDIMAAKEKLEECLRVIRWWHPIKKITICRHTIKSARELLRNIWDFKIRPSWWRWWWCSPLLKWTKRFTFILLGFCILGLFLVHPFIPKLIPITINIKLYKMAIDMSLYMMDINMSLYIMFVALLIIVLISPSLERIKTKEIELDLHQPPSFEPFLSPMVMETMMKTIDEKYSNL